MSEYNMLVENGQVLMAKDYASDAKDQVLTLYPDCFCICIEYSSNNRRFYILQDAGPQHKFIGHSPKSQRLAWENAWAVISRKMMKKLEMQ